MCRRQFPAVVMAAIISSCVLAGAGVSAQPLVSIGDARVVEGDSLSARARFTLIATGPVCAPISVDYATLDGSASTADGDFVATTGTATLLPDPPQYASSWTGGGAGFLNQIIAGRNDDLFAVDLLSNRVLQFDRNLTLIRSWGSPGTGPGQFSGPRAIAQAYDGNVFVTDNGNHRIQKFDATGNFLEEWGSAGSGPGQFDFFLLSIAIDSANNVYVSDRALDGLTGRIQKFDQLGNFVTQWPTADARPVELAMGTNGYLYANVWDVNGNVANIEVFAPDGTPLTVWNNAATAGQLRGGARFTFDRCGRVYISDIDRVVVAREDGTFISEWPALVTPSSHMRFLSALCVDDAGRLFAAQDGSPDISEFAITHSAVVDVPVTGDTNFEADEAFVVQLSNPQNAAISDGAGDGNIVNDDSEVGPNLILNPSFDTSLIGWGPTSDATLSLSPEGHDDASAVLVTAASDSAKTFGLNDSPDAVDFAEADWARYRFTAWVRLASGAGSARLKVREYAGAVLQGSRVSSAMSLDSTWRPIVISVLTVFAGSHFDMQVVMDPDGPGGAFLVDDVAAERLLGDAPPILTVPSLVTRSWAQSMSLPVQVRDPDGDAIRSLTADLAALPGGNNGRFTPLFDQSSGTLRWEPGAMAVRDAPYQVVVRARNSFVAVDTITIRVPDNVVVDPSFAEGIAGWNGNSGAQLEWISPGRTDDHALRATNALGFSSFGVTDSPNWSFSPAAGTVVEASVWVRSPNGGGPAWLWFREYQNGLLVGSETSERVPLSNDWIQLRWPYHSLRASGSTNSTIDFLVQMASSQLGAFSGAFAGGEQLEIDDASITYQSIPTLAVPEIAVGDRMQLVSPNPVRSSATLRFATTRRGRLLAQIFDLNGRVVRTLADESDAPAGARSFVLRTRDEHGHAIASGMYFYRVASTDGVQRGRFVVLN
jgi:hypothetical protein